MKKMLLGIELGAGGISLADTRLPAPGLTTGRSNRVEPLLLLAVDNDRRARAVIETDGYKGVENLRKAADGSWWGEARWGSTLVGLTVDAAANVSAD